MSAASQIDDPIYWFAKSEVGTHRLDHMCSVVNPSSAEEHSLLRSAE